MKSKLYPYACVFTAFMYSQVPSHALESRFFELDYEEVAAQSDQATELGRLLTEAFATVKTLLRDTVSPILIQSCCCRLEEIFLEEDEEFVSSYWRLPVDKRLFYTYRERIGIKLIGRIRFDQNCDLSADVLIDIGKEFPLGRPKGFLWKSAAPLQERETKNLLVCLDDIQPSIFISVCYMSPSDRPPEHPAQVCIIIHEIIHQTNDIPVSTINWNVKKAIPESRSSLPDYIFSLKDDFEDEASESYGKEIEEEERLELEKAEE
jgi:hypothetical protein